MKAALQAKQKNDIEQAKVFLRTAKGFDPMIEAARDGKTVDISTVSRQKIYCDSSNTGRVNQVNPLYDLHTPDLVLEMGFMACVHPAITASILIHLFYYEKVYTAPPDYYYSEES